VSSYFAIAAVLAAACLGAFAGCSEQTDEHIYIQEMLGDGCDYDAEQQGIEFSFYLAGSGDADMVAEIHRADPGVKGGRPGPVIASAVNEVRNSDYDNPITIVVPLAESQFDAKLIKCVLQTETYGPDVVRKDGKTAAP
jgi:hypothetical protein